MQTATIKRLTSDVSGKRVGGWDVGDYIGSGKSAIVFAATRNGQAAALKVFDPDLVEQVGPSRQLKRIQRELSLQNASHPNLVRVFDGGACPETGHHFVVMERIDAPNLAQVIKEVPRESIRPIIAQIADAAHFMEGLLPALAHRDIKPDNISISRDFTSATLLDLGVILPIDLGDQVPSSDQERAGFLGTSRYGPPEFLVRREKYTIEGWRAVTFYQLGAVLYDLIMKERIFEEFAEPPARLHLAVAHETPRIKAKDVPEELILLASNCLSKDPEIRLRYVSWDDFKIKAPSMSPAADARERVRRRLAQTYASTSEQDRATDDRNRAMLRAVQHVQSRLHSLIKSGWVKADVPYPIECHEYPGDESGRGYVSLIVPASRKLSLSTSLCVWFTITIVDDKSLVTEIDYRACLSDEQPLAHDPENPQTRRLFAGVFQEGVVQTSAIDLLYRLLDFAQANASVIPNPRIWVDLPGGEKA